MSTLAATLAAVLELSPADRAAVVCAIRAADAGLEFDTASVRQATDADARALCGRAAPIREATPLAEFEILDRHVQILRTAVDRVAAMVKAKGASV